MNDQYDHEQELDPSIDTLQFGKHLGKTPLELGKTVAGQRYLIWAWENTVHWCGGEQYIRSLYSYAGMNFKPRMSGKAALPSDNVIEQFEEAVFRAYGAFPKPLWIK